DLGPYPVQISRVLARRHALGIRHGGIELPGGMVFEVEHEGVVEVERFGACHEVDEGEEAESVTQLMQNDAEQVDLGARRIGVEAVIPAPRERAGGADGAVKWGRD